MDNTINFKKKIKEIMDYYHLNKNSFSKEIGNNDNSAITHLINKGRQPSMETINKILTRFPVSAEWFFRDEGSMFGIDSPIKENRMTGKEAKEIRVNSGLSVQDFAEQLGYKGFNPIYYNEDKEFVGRAYQRSITRFMENQGYNSLESIDYKEEFHKLLGRYNEAKESRVGIEDKVLELEKQQANIYYIICKLQDQIEGKGKS
jgi:transcriptional regulator with XRE-family HTH domain